MVTSREALSLQEEWLYSVGGMFLPTSLPTSALATAETLSAIQDNGAIQLFVQRARHVDASFELSNQNVQSVVRICQLVDGMPLGIELAAAWGRTMSYQEIADEIENGIDIWSTSLRNVPERHRSVRAAIATSWQYLSDNQQEQFAKLSVFRGGFSREAAQQIVSVSLHALSLFVDKPLLTFQRDSQRYSMHAMLQAVFGRTAR